MITSTCRLSRLSAWHRVELCSCEGIVKNGMYTRASTGGRERSWWAKQWGLNHGSRSHDEGTPVPLPAPCTAAPFPGFLQCTHCTHARVERMDNWRKGRGGQKEGEKRMAWMEGQSCLSFFSSRPSFLRPPLPAAPPSSSLSPPSCLHTHTRTHAHTHANTKPHKTLFPLTQFSRCRPLEVTTHSACRHQLHVGRRSMLMSTTWCAPWTACCGVLRAEETRTDLLLCLDPSGE